MRLLPRLRPSLLALSFTVALASQARAVPPSCSTICSSDTCCSDVCYDGHTTTCGDAGYACNYGTLVPPCANYSIDRDCDGVNDALEQALAKRYEPVYLYTSGEKFYHGRVQGYAPVYGPADWTVYFHAKRLVNTSAIQIIYWHIFNKDRCPEGNYCCQGHSWDTEHVAMLVNCTGVNLMQANPAGCVADRVNYNFHEVRAFAYYSKVRKSGTHPLVFVQAGKHGSYPCSRPQDGCVLPNFEPVQYYKWLGNDGLGGEVYYAETPSLACRDWSPGGYVVCGGNCNLVNVGDKGYRSTTTSCGLPTSVGLCTNDSTNNTCWVNYNCGGKWGGATAVCNQINEYPWYRVLPPPP